MFKRCFFHRSQFWFEFYEKTSSSPEFDFVHQFQKESVLFRSGSQKPKPLCLGLTLQTQELDHTDNYSYSLRLSLG
jgi:hypothetical protein